jgi:hypothetical protein
VTLNMLFSFVTAIRYVLIHSLQVFVTCKYVSRIYECIHSFTLQEGLGCTVLVFRVWGQVLFFPLYIDVINSSLNGIMFSVPLYSGPMDINDG